DFEIHSQLIGGSPLWTTNNVQLNVVQGIYSVELGPITPNVLVGDNAYLQITVGEDILVPRMKINSVGYALQAGAVTGEENVFPSDGSVGIGTTAPARKLEVSLNDANDATVIPTLRLHKETNAGGAGKAGMGTSIEFECEDGGGGFQVIGEIQSLMTQSTYGDVESDMRFLTEDQGDDGLATRMTIDKDGDVGIGTTDPDSGLHIYDKGPGLHIQNSSNHIKLTDTAGGEPAYIWMNGGTGDLRLWANGDDRIYIKNNGNVGIGTTDPDTPLHVSANVNGFKGIHIDNSNSGSSAAAYLYLTGDSGNGQIFQQSSTNTGYGGAKSLNLYASSGPISFSSNGAGSSEMIIKAGNVGIGTTAPTEKLVVNSAEDNSSAVFSSTDGTAFIMVSDNASAAYTGVSSGRVFLSHTAPGTGMDMVIDSDGSVGIGTVAPNAKLEVAGTVSASAFVKDGAALLEGKWDGSPDIYYTGGNVGIGTTNPADWHPSYKLLQLGSYTGLADLSTGYTKLGNNYYESATGHKHINNGYASYYQQYEGAHSFFVTDTNPGAGGTMDKIYAMKIINNGNVGIGNDSPTGLLHVSANALVVNSGGSVGIGTAAPESTTDIFGDLAVHADGTDQNYGGLRIHTDRNGDYNTYIDMGRDREDARMHFRIGDKAVGGGEWGSGTVVDVMTLEGNGNVGIGTTGLIGKLHINGGSNPYGGTNSTLVMEDAQSGTEGYGRVTTRLGPGSIDIGRNIYWGAGNWAQDVAGYSSGLLQIYNSSGADEGSKLVFSTVEQGDAPNMKTRLMIDKNGNVGIGTAAPGELLHVNSTSNTNILLDNDVASGGGASILFANQQGNKAKIASNLGNDSIQMYIDQDMSNYTFRMDGNFLQMPRINNYSDVFLDTYSTTDSHDSRLFLRKSPVATIDNFTTATVDGENLGSIVFQGADGSNDEEGAVIQAVQDGAAGDYVPANLLLETYSSTGKNSSQLVLHNDGNVGIGSASPLKKLDVAGDFRTSGWLTRAQTQEYSFYITQANNGDGRWDLFEFSYDIGNWQSAGIEIEVTRPGYNNPQKTVFYAKRGYGNSLDYEVIYGGNIVGYWHSETVVAGNIKKATFAINYDNYYQYLINIKTQSSYSVVPTITSSDQIKIVNSWNETQVATTNTGHTLFAQNGGNVGIGTASPVEKLDINGNLRMQAGNYIKTDGGNYARVWTPGQTIGSLPYMGTYGTGMSYLAKYDSGWKGIAGGTAAFLGVSEGQLTFANAPSAGADAALTWTDRFVIKQSGNVGIGTADPESSFHVAGTTGSGTQTVPGIHMFLRSGTQPEMQFYGSGGTIIDFTDASGEDADWRLGANSTHFRIGATTTQTGGFTILTDGKVGINNAVPAYDLDVVGTINASEAVLVNGEAADYVFETDYDLKSIEEQAAFMWSNKHLPALKGAEELGGQINIAERLEQAVEELEKAHVYIDQLDKTTKELKAEKDKEIQELKAKNEAMEAELKARIEALEAR
ncbi:hypothetical protein ACFL57_04165, partial [Candidatus Margulisiibacteriota bacterium]